MSLLSQFYPQGGGGGASVLSRQGSIPPGHIGFYEGKHEFQANKGVNTYGDNGPQSISGSASTVFRCANYYVTGGHSGQDGPYSGPINYAIAKGTHKVISGHAAQLGYKGSDVASAAPNLDYQEALSVSGIKLFQGYQKNCSFNFPKCEAFYDMWFEQYEGNWTLTLGDLKTCYNVGGFEVYAGMTSTVTFGSGADPVAVSTLILGVGPFSSATVTINGFDRSNLTAEAEAHVASRGNWIFAP